jgi:hypothetical protein
MLRIANSPGITLWSNHSVTRTLKKRPIPRSFGPASSSSDRAASGSCRRWLTPRRTQPRVRIASLRPRLGCARPTSRLRRPQPRPCSNHRPRHLAGGRFRASEPAETIRGSNALWHANDRFAPIVLKNSKIARLRKSRKCSVLMISAAATPCRIDTRASDRFCGNFAAQIMQLNGAPPGPPVDHCLKRSSRSEPGRPCVNPGPMRRRFA